MFPLRLNYTYLVRVRGQTPSGPGDHAGTSVRGCDLKAWAGERNGISADTAGAVEHGSARDERGDRRRQQIAAPRRGRSQDRRAPDHIVGEEPLVVRGEICVEIGHVPSLAPEWRECPPPAPGTSPPLGTPPPALPPPPPPPP